MASLPIPTREVPLELKCSICWEISIDPVIPAKTLTDEKIEEVCKHFLCKTCEHINNVIALENTKIDEISCPQCKQKYSSVLPDAKKVKDFVEGNPDTFDRKSYDELVEERRASIPIAIQIMDAIKNEKLYDIKKISASIEDPKEKSKILFEIATKQLKNENIGTAKFLLKLIPNENFKAKLASFITLSIFDNYEKKIKKFSDIIEEIEEFIESLSDEFLQSIELTSITSFTQKFLHKEDLTEEDKKYLIQKNLEWIDRINSFSNYDEFAFKRKCKCLILKTNLYFSINAAEESQKYFSEFKEQFKDIPDGLEKFFKTSDFFLFLFNKIYALELLEEMENQILKLKLNEELKDLVYMMLFQFSAKLKNSKKMEDYARELSENGSTIKKIEKALQEYNENLIIYLKKHLEFYKTIAAENITVTTPKIFALYATAHRYISNDEFEKGGEIFNEINQTDDTCSIPYRGLTISVLKEQIKQFSEILYATMLYDGKTAIREKIKEYKLITEEKAREIEQSFIEYLEIEKEKENQLKRIASFQKIVRFTLISTLVGMSAFLIGKYFDK